MRQSRRQFVGWSTLAAAAAGVNVALPAWARSGAATGVQGLSAVSGTTFDLSISQAQVPIDGRLGNAILINDSLPGPLLRWREGQDVTLRVTNHLGAPTSIHWHGLLLPPGMDGVPGVSFPGIAPGETFVYRYPILQAGTYWYHSHSGLQEQLGHYGPIVIEPKADPVSFDREYVLVLSDWTFENPHHLYAKLKKKSNVYNRQRRTLVELIGDAREQGWGTVLADRSMWGRMRMDATDLSDVTASTYSYLINGHGVSDNWTGLFRAGERVRLRFVNAAAMTIFNVRIPGLPMTVVQSDGLDLQPVETDEFQIGVAETFDVVVQPLDSAYTIMAESNDRSGFGRATLAVREGLSAPIPELRPRPVLSMRDMAMAHDMEGGGHGGHKAMGHDMEGGGHGGHKAMGHDMEGGGHDGHKAMGHDMEGGGHGGHKAMGHGRMSDENAKPASHHAHKGHRARATRAAATSVREGATQIFPHAKGPGVVGLADVQQFRLDERPFGLEDAPHRVLVYADLKSLTPIPDPRPPERELELHLTGNMERYMWSFDGVKLSEVDGPIVFHEGERLRLVMVNNTMMLHPVHLHGMFFELNTGEDLYRPRKHTVTIKPGERLSIDVTADAFGDWAFHCHLLYHMHAGMMRVVSVRRQDGTAWQPA